MKLGPDNCISYSPLRGCDVLKQKRKRTLERFLELPQVSFSKRKLNLFGVLSLHHCEQRCSFLFFDKKKVMLPLADLGVYRYFIYFKKYRFFIHLRVYWLKYFIFLYCLEAKL